MNKNVLLLLTISTFSALHAATSDHSLIDQKIVYSNGETITVKGSFLQTTLLRKIAEENTPESDQKVVAMMTSWREEECAINRLLKKFTDENISCYSLQSCQKTLKFNRRNLKEFIKIASLPELHSCIQEERAETYLALKLYHLAIFMLKNQGKLINDGKASRAYAAKIAMTFGLWDQFRELQKYLMQAK